MKRFFLILVAILPNAAWASANVECYKNNPSLNIWPHTRDMLCASGPIKKTAEMSEELKNGPKLVLPSRTSYLEFRQDGKLIRDWTEFDNVDFKTQESKYEWEGDKPVFYDSGVDTLRYTYDKNGRVVEEKIFSNYTKRLSSTNIYSYEMDGDAIKRKRTYKRENNESLSEIAFFDKKGRMIRNTEIYSQRTNNFKYLENKEYYITEHWVDGDLPNRTYFSKKHGFAVLRTGKNKNAQTVYEYKLDKRGNWVWMQEYKVVLDDKGKEIQRDPVDAPRIRTIEYWGDPPSKSFAQETAAKTKTSGRNSYDENTTIAMGSDGKVYSVPNKAPTSAVISVSKNQNVTVPVKCSIVSTGDIQKRGLQDEAREMKSVIEQSKGILVDEILICNSLEGNMPLKNHYSVESENDDRMKIVTPNSITFGRNHYKLIVGDPPTSFLLVLGKSG